MVSLYTDGSVDDAHEVLGFGEIDQNFEQEAVKLGFWQGIGAFHFEWVLCCQHEEWFGERTCAITYADSTLLHAFKQGRLRLRGGTVYFICKDDVGKDGAWLEAEHAP